MGLSPSKPITGTAAERTALTTPENRPPTLVLHPRHDSPVSPLSRHSRRSSIPSHAIRMEGHESGGVIRVRRGSDMALVTDTGSTAVDSDRSQINYGQSWGREAQSLHVSRTQPLRSEPEAYECRSPATSDRVFEIQSIRERPSLRIICPLLQGVLKRASVNSLSAFQREELFSPASTIIEPYEWLFHNRKKIIQAAREDTEKHTSSHVELLLEFIKKERPVTWEKLNELELGKCRKISFGDLWLIYPAGATVFTKDNGEWRAYKVERTELSCRSGTDAMLIHCLYLDLKTTGQWLTPQQEVLTVHFYSSERTIGDLEVVPDWHFGRSGLSEKLIEQGKKFWNYSRKVNYKEYHGHAWPRSSRNDPVKVIIDYVTSSRHERETRNTSTPSCGGSTCSVCLGEAFGLPSYPIEAPHDLDACMRISHDITGESKDFSEGAQDSLLFCPPRMWAFSLRHKSWELILPQDIDEVQQQDDALDQLMMKNDSKKYLESALFAHLEDESRINGDDIVRGKGRGFNILLHGNPGTGKTLTAECLAAKHVIPLYRITCGDLGTDLDVLEKRLEEVFLRATNWKALLLLDGADIFVQARDVQDLRRYAVASIFLHHLDNSEAFLLMTTNRADKLDQALEPRINMPIYLPDIDFEAQKAIWKNWIWRLESPTHSQKLRWEEFIDFELQNAEEGACNTMNGRQIRNCITAASTLARKDGESLNVMHVRKMLKLGREFRELLHEKSDSPRDRKAFLARNAQHLKQ